jgi:hypothetical protein
MENKAHERYKWIRGQEDTDGEYRHLLQRLRENGPAFQAAMEALPQEHRESVTEHLGILAELYERITEICCYVP